MSLETARSLANEHSGGGAEGEFPENCSVSCLSFVYGSSGGVCGWSLGPEHTWPLCLATGGRVFVADPSTLGRHVCYVCKR